MRRIYLAVALAALLFLGRPAQAQWTPDTTVVLRGKIVSMDRAVRAGQVVVKNGKIEAILTPAAAVPADAIVIETNGYIYPGLINLHNHLRYNFLGLYDLPGHTENHDEWPTGKSYAEHVNNPAAVVTGNSAYGLLDEALKYAEVRAIVGGETSIQGAENNPAIKRSLVRNVELENFGEDTIGQRALTIDRLFLTHLADTIDSIKATKAWIFHLAEGIDEYSRLEWSDPSWDPTQPFSVSKSRRNRPGVIQADLVWPGLVGVHCTAMEEADFAEWRQIVGGAPKIVWSPTSNFLLYGKTTDIRAAQRQGALIALGTDWAPSGPKNLLWELKAVDALNRQSSPRMFRGYKAILELVTTTPAKILGWEDRVGKIREGFYADLLVVDDVGGSSGYHNLILANEADVQLVLVDGNPLYGDEAHLQRLKVYEGQPRYELLPDSAPNRPKAIDMLEAPDERNGDLSLAEVVRRLEEALRLDAPALADKVNAGVQETQTRTTYKAREYIKEQLVKLLERKGEPVDDDLRDPDTSITAAHAARFLELKYPHLQPIQHVDPLFTDERFFDALEANVHWKEPYSVDLDLRPYHRPAQPAPFGGNVAGMAAALPIPGE